MVTALPSNFNTGQVTGRFVDLQGRFEQGKVTFTARAPRLESDATDTVVVGVPIVVFLVNGEIDIQLPATNDPDITPTGFTYQVTEEFSNGYIRQYDIDVPVGSVTDLSDVVSTDPSTGETVIRTPSDPPQLIDLTGESGAVALDLSTGTHEVQSSVSAVLIQCDSSVTLTVTPPTARQTRLGVVVRVTGGGDVVLRVAGNTDELSGSDEVSAYLEPVPSGLETPMVFGPRINPPSISGLVTDLAAKAPLASPALTGSPTAPTQSAGDNSTKVATTAYVDGRGKYRTVLSTGATGSVLGGVPGGSIIGNLAYTNNIYPSNFLIYEWFICPFDLDITALYARTITGGASSNTRIGLVEGTKSFQPTGSMLTESSSVATTANETLVTHTPGTPIRLTAGRVYATTIQFDGTAPTWYCLLNTNGPAHQGGWSWPVGPDRAIYALRVSRSYAAVSGTPPAWDTVSNTSNLTWNRSVLMTWTEA